MNIVGELRDKVRKERLEKGNLETTIRREVTQEMNELIVEIESSHKLVYFILGVQMTAVARSFFLFLFSPIFFKEGGGGTSLYGMAKCVNVRVLLLEKSCIVALHYQLLITKFYFSVDFFLFYFVKKKSRKYL